MDGPKGCKWTVLKMDGREKVDESKLVNVSNLKRLFPMYLFCLQSSFCVSNKLFVSKNIVSNVSFFCFQSITIVSNLILCFQSNLFPIYASNLHITHGIVIELHWDTELEKHEIFRFWSNSAKFFFSI